MPIDVERARRETPGCQHVAHFNNAGASLMPRPVLDAVVDYLNLEATIGGYEAVVREADRISRVYDSAARLINCDRSEIALVEHATRAWDLAFYSVPFRAGDRILTTVSEYAANYVAFLQVAARTGAKVEVVPNDEHGQISVGELERMMDGRVRLVAINHVPTNGGLVNPAAEVGRVARAAGVMYLLDACQSVGQMPVDVEEIGCDMLSTTGRKFLRGPRGTGFLYVRRSALDLLDPVMLDHFAAEWVAPDRYEIRPDARRFENWEASYACRLGLGAAIDYALGWGLDAVWERAASLAAGVRERLSEVPGVEVRDVGERKGAIVTFTVDGVPANEVKTALVARGVNVSALDAFSARLDFEARDLAPLVRASVHYFNTDEEIDRLIREIRKIRGEK